MLALMRMEHGRDHDERQQKAGTRIDQQLDRRGDDDVPPELDRRALARDPGPTPQAAEEERKRHAKQGTRGGNC
jgi:hypothetical protein